MYVILCVHKTTIVRKYKQILSAECTTFLHRSNTSNYGKLFSAHLMD